MHKIGRIASWAAVIVLAGAVFSRSAEATFVMDINQVGPDVVVTGSGTINLGGLTLDFSQALIPEIKAQFSVAIVGTAAFDNVYIGGISGPGNFGIGNNIGPDTASGNLVGIGGGGTQLAVPAGYVSGSALSDTMTIDAATYADIGVTVGTYTWSWGTPGTNFDSFVLDIHPVTELVPEPSTLALLAAGLLALGFARRKADARRIPVRAGASSD